MRRPGPGAIDAPGTATLSRNKVWPLGTVVFGAVLPVWPRPTITALLGTPAASSANTW